ncbi:glycoside hydrolase family 2 TIM barrel-domain containing protein [Paludicola sp. MB14-C6]|uniref:glycoside hydrolase family 2 protein n=1 Tax=Paludihabitans sp. MB14-C6 TaxID=3070656 RepID=UPI0027DDB977|nr:glycoside hydrolase family 2 TIM barrel-domain containing protein [Paludicola sp. MB14-C6]WMJ23696.1 glycoside hydrolase family 2 TIM barrel-domain containing protein [Paludicola sp. MB14-C6]
MNTIQLNDWKVLGTLPYQADFSKHMQEGAELSSLTEWFPASVPGSIYDDLQAAHYIEDPFFGTNSLNCEWVANRWWIYKTTFQVKQDDMNDILKLTFKGIDYSAQIYLNGKKLGYHEGMYIPFEAIINEYVKVNEENILVCILEHAPFADAQPGYTSKTKYLKARYNYKWDFAARIVNLGIYDEVVISKHSIASIAHSFFRPIRTKNGWNMEIDLDIDGYADGEINVGVSFNIPRTDGPCTGFTGSKMKIVKGFNKYNCTISLNEIGFEPELWWPNGYGEQKLYDFTASLYFNELLSDEVTHKVGFRTLQYQHADGREDALPYNVVINGKKIYLKGTNIVPLSSTLGSISYDTLKMKLTAAKECNINFFRIWGGGHIESEAFYSLCDELGIMIMQEFTMSSSGCDDVPSQDKHFLDLLHKAAVHNVKLKRNHVSLTLWSGGNELTDSRYLGTEDHEGHPATFEDSTLAMLKGTIDALSPDVMMLPSSASGPNALLKVGDIGNNHDVHGPWGYVGAYDHYEFYNNSDSILHGEFGCGGISNYDTLKRFLAPEDLKLCTSAENRVWRHHSGGWDSYSMRERLLFGDLHHIPFQDYIKINQFIQAESLRYSLEANRRRQWKNVGEMTWQFNEPWPNIQCSNVLDYYGEKKLAYYVMRDAYLSVLTSLKYDKLFYKAGEAFNAELFIINDKRTADYKIKYEIVNQNNNTLSSAEFSGTATEDVSQKVGSIAFTIPESLTGGFTVRITTSCGDFNGTKEYLMLMADKKVDVTLSQEEQLAIKHYKNKQFTNGIDALRADTAPVIRYYDNFIEKYL